MPQRLATKLALIALGAFLAPAACTRAPVVPDEALVHTDRVGYHHAYWHDPTITAAHISGEALLASIVPPGATIVDLTHVFDEETLYWPSETFGFRREAADRGRSAASAAGHICAPEQGGTHLDAPAHLAAGKSTADRVPLPRLMAKAVVIDIAAKAAVNPDAQLEPADITAFEQRHGELAAGTIVLIRSGWSERWPDRKRYLGDDRPRKTDGLHFPGITPEAAELLVERAVAAVGIDTASLDHGPSKTFAARRVLANAEVPTFENVAQLGMVPETGAVVIALPMKIGGGSGGPLRIVAVVP